MNKIIKMHIAIVAWIGIHLFSLNKIAASADETYAKTVEGITLIDRVEFEKTFKKHWEDATPKERQKFLKKKKKRKKRKTAVGKQAHENVEITTYESVKKKTKKKKKTSRQPPNVVSDPISSQPIDAKSDYKLPSLKKPSMLKQNRPY